MNSFYSIRQAANKRFELCAQYISVLIKNVVLGNLTNAFMQQLLF